MGVGWVKANGLKGVGGRLATVCGGSTVACGGVVSRLGQGGALMTDSG